MRPQFQRIRPWVLPIGLILFLLAFFFLFTTTGRWIAGRVSSIFNTTQNNSSVLYVCPLLEDNAPEVATCEDCTLYPVDKTHQLPATYAPHVVPTNLPGGGWLVPAASTALQELFSDAYAHGLLPVVTSAYRSYDEQAQTFNSWFAQEWYRTPNFILAFINAERYSASPGHSEHQLGTAVDLNCKRCAAFDRNDEDNLALWKYLEENAHRFGFVISYPRDMEARTGYLYEPWHIRYIGEEYATALYEQGYTQGNGICELSLLRLKKAY
jgi:D-alanyl-D-alanine carboxypeptidase